VNNICVIHAACPNRLLAPGGAIDNSELKAKEFCLDHLKRVDEFKTVSRIA